LPDPISDDATGDHLHSQHFESESVGTGGLVPTDFQVVDGWRVWRFRHLPGEDDLRGRTALGIQVEWPKRGAPSNWEPMELFAYPPMAPMVPDEWSAWATAASQRAGAFRLVGRSPRQRPRACRADRPAVRAAVPALAEGPPVHRLTGSKGPKPIGVNRRPGTPTGGVVT
jgi:hypothetical protein